jgi:adenylate kinase family enzyme
MLKDESARNPSIGQVIQAAMDNDEPVPDEIVSSLVE